MTREDFENDTVNENELRELFSALNSVHASDKLKNETSAAILAKLADVDSDATALPGAAPTIAVAAADGNAKPASSPSGTQATSSSKDASISQNTSPSLTVPASTGKSKRGIRSRIRVVRIAAIAACLAFALTGGIAYATPTAHVQVGEGPSSIELGVNPFGITVSADSADEELNKRANEAPLRNKPYKESLDEALNLLDEFAENPDSDALPPIAIETQSPDQRAHLEQDTTDATSKRRQSGNDQPPAGATPESAAPDAAAPSDARQEPQGAGPSHNEAQAPDGVREEPNTSEPASFAERGSEASPEDPDNTRGENPDAQPGNDHAASSPDSPANQPPTGAPDNQNQGAGAPGPGSGRI